MTFSAKDTQCLRVIDNMYILNLFLASGKKAKKSNFILNLFYIDLNASCINLAMSCTSKNVLKHSGDLTVGTNSVVLIQRL